jgi:hypothetical protein
MAGAADLAGLVWVDLIDSDTGAFCLVLYQFYEGSPPSIVYTFIQTAFRGCTIVQVVAVLILLGLWPLDHIVH